MAPRTLYEKIWDDHAIGDDLLFVDLHLVHEVTSPQAFEGLRLAGRRVRRPTARWPPPTTTSRRATCASRSPTTCRASSSRRSTATAPSSASRCTASATAARASST